MLEINEKGFLYMKEEKGKQGMKENKNIDELNKVLLRNFKGFYVDNLVDKEDFSKLLERASYTVKLKMMDACKRGIWVSQELLTYPESSLLKLLETSMQWFGFDIQNAASTFYDDFKQVQDTPEELLKVYQLIQYVTFELNQVGLLDKEQVFIPNQLDIEKLEQDVKKLVEIKALTRADIETKVKSLLSSGMPLDVNLVNDLDYLVSELGILLNYDDIANREFACLMVVKGKVALPKNLDEFFRVVSYVSGFGTQLRKYKRELEKQTYYQALTCNAVAVEKLFNRFINLYGETYFAQHCTRYRKMVLILRKVFKNKTVLNRILENSKKVNIPRKFTVLETVLDPKWSNEVVEDSLRKATIYQLIRIYNYIQEKMVMDTSTNKDQVYTNRMGKMFFKECKDPFVFLRFNTFDLYKTRLDILDKVLKERAESYKLRLEKENKRVAIYLPKEQRLKYKVPTSQKNFLGTYPMFSTIRLDKSLNVGIYWNRDVDLDLSLVSSSGELVAWHSHTKLGGWRATHSGDMRGTNRHGFASEILHIENNSKEEDYYTVKVAMYTPFTDKGLMNLFITEGEKVTVGQDQYKMENIVKNPVLNVKVDEPTTTSPKVLGCICTSPTTQEVEFILADKGLGTGRVAGVDNKAISKVIKRKVDTALEFRTFLDLIGIEVIETEIQKEELVNQVQEWNNNQELDKLDLEVMDFSQEVVTVDTFTTLLNELN